MTVRSESVARALHFWTPSFTDVAVFLTTRHVFEH